MEGLRGSVVMALSGGRLDLSDEKLTQAGVATLLRDAGPEAEREARLSDRDIVDFLVEGRIAVEVKLRSSGKMAVHRQLRRYAEHERVSGIVLVTNLAMTLPHAIEGKPTSVVSLGRGWL